MAEKGYEEITTKDVAQRAGVGEGTLYRFIEKKTDLLLLVIGEEQDRLIDQLISKDDLVSLNPLVEQDGAWYIERINYIYRKRIELFVRSPEHVAKYVMSGLQSESKLGTMSIASGDRIVTRVQRIVENAQSVDRLRNDVEAIWVARNINGLYIHEILRSTPRRLSVDETWGRLSHRFDVVLRPLLVDAKGNVRSS